MDIKLKSKALSDLMQKIDKINLRKAANSALSDFMAATKILDEFTQKVKAELKLRIEADTYDGTDYVASSRVTESIADEEKTVKLLKSLGFEEDELYERRMKSASVLKNMMSIKDRDKLETIKKISSFIKKNTKKK